MILRERLGSDSDEHEILRAVNAGRFEPFTVQSALIARVKEMAPNL